MSTNPSEWFVGILLSGLIAWLGYRRESLSGSGVIGALLIGTLTFGLGGWTWGLLLIGFFVTSSALSHYRSRDKERLAEKFAKGSRRDLGQALANGGWGTALALLQPIFLMYGLAYGPAYGALLFAAYVGAMAAVNADTWATELGVLSKTEPRLITTGRRVPVGTSGGVSALGSGAALLGALVIAGLALVVRAVYVWTTGAGDPAGVGWTGLLPLLWLVPAGVVGGLAGSFLDSVLGATVQGIYTCDACQKETERPVHRCGQETRLVRGWRWLDNDGVNLICSVAGSLVAGLIWVILTR